MNKFLVFETNDDKEYKVKTIKNNSIYTKKANRHLLRLYYLVVWNSYPKEKNIWKLLSEVMHL